MFLHIAAVRYLDAYRLELGFSDGSWGVADLSDELRGPVFSELLDQGLFSRVALNSELGTIQWPNGADLAPEFLYFLSFKNDRAQSSKFKAWGFVAED